MRRLSATRVAEYGIEWDELLLSAPEYGMLQLGYFCDPERLMRDSLIVHRHDEPQFLLPLARTGDGWESHPETFACGLLPLGEPSPLDVWPAVQTVSRALEGQSLRVRLKPAVASPAFADHEAGAWRLLPSRVVRSDAVMVADVRSDLALSSRRRRGLARAVKNGLFVRRATDQEVLGSAWRCVEDVYGRRGLPGPIPVDRVRDLVGLPGDVASVLAVEVDGRVIGGALGYRLGKSYRLPVYALTDAPDAVGGTESLILAAADVARAKGCEVLDLGTSTDPRTGETVEGIATFKAEMGARPRALEHLAVDLRSPPAG